MLRLGKEKDSLSVVYDQVGTPTYARDLAQVCLEIISKQGRIDSKGKLYHYSNEGVASWYDFAQALMDMAHIDCKLKPIESKYLKDDLKYAIECPGEDFPGKDSRS